MVTLAISCLTTSNLPWFMDLTFQVPMQYCCFWHQILLPSPVTSTARCCFCFGFVSSSFLESFFPLISSSILGTYRPGEFIFQCHVFLPFPTAHGGSQGKKTEVFAIPFSSGPRFVRTSTMTHPSWVTLHGMAHSFIELDKAVISLISFLWLWFSFCLPCVG